MIRMLSVHFLGNILQLFWNLHLFNRRYSVSSVSLPWSVAFDFFGIWRTLGPNQSTWRWIDRPTSESSLGFQLFRAFSKRSHTFKRLESTGTQHDFDWCLQISSQLLRYIFCFYWTLGVMRLELVCCSISLPQKMPWIQDHASWSDPSNLDNGFGQIVSVDMRTSHIYTYTT